MNQKGFANRILIVFFIVLVGALGYITLIKKSAPIEQPQHITPLSISNTASQNPPANQTIATSPQSLPTSCVDEVHSSNGKDLPPVITSISPTSGPVGTSVELRGCNLAGFEGGQVAIFERSDGKKLTFYGSGYNEKIMTIKVVDNCPTGSEIGHYSGIRSTCETIKALPGVYKVYTVTWGDEFKSNIVTFTVK